MNERPEPGEISPDTPGEVYIMPGRILWHEEYLAACRQYRADLRKHEGLPPLPASRPHGNHRSPASARSVLAPGSVYLDPGSLLAWPEYVACHRRYEADLREREAAAQKSKEIVAAAQETGEADTG